MATFDDVLQQVLVLLHHEGRLSYRALKRRFEIDDDYIEDLKAELIDAKRVAVDEEGKVLVWVKEGEKGETAKRRKEDGERGKEVVSSQLSVLSLQPPVPSPQPPSAERRQLTVMFCDLVGSTALSTQLDPEDLRTVVQHYQQTCAAVIQRHEGYIAQYLGDGLLVYFGYPTAHEDDARRAVRAGLEIITALRTRVPSPLVGEEQGEGATGKQLQVRIGIHSGLVVIGEIGASGRTEQLALGETPNIAARIQSLAEPNTVIISAATQRLIEGQFESQPFGSHLVKGIATPIAVYHVQSERQGTAPLAWRTTLTPLVGREEELALLQRRWEQVKDREGQVALLSGEPGIGKSRLVRELRDRVEQDGAVCIEFRCSPYHQNSALQPVIEHLQRLLQWQKDDSPQTKTAKLQTTLAQYRFPQADTLALFAVLLSLPHPPDAPQLNLSPQRQKQKTEEALIAWLLEEAEHAPVYCVWEDLHWADPSTLELLGMLIDQAPTARLFVLLTSRPEFTPPWGQHGHFSHLTLSRLGRRQVPQLIEKATGGKSLPTEVVQQIVAKTDGVPLFVEELIKMVLESGLLTEAYDHYELTGPLPPLAIPSTLQDSLMARLDRLASVRELAQLGATIGREFAYDLLQAVSPLNNELLQAGLQQLVATELVYQRGAPPHASYIFKHALIQDTAYQSLLKSRRQQLHQQIAQVLEERFPNTKDTQPELLAHHYTEAGLITQATPYWHQAGQRAVQRSANAEAVSHLTKGLELLKLLPDTLERTREELTLQTTLGPALIATRGYAAPEVGTAYIRARELCRQLGETPHLVPVLGGLWQFYLMRAEYQTACELGELLLTLAQNMRDPVVLVMAHDALGQSFFCLGELDRAHAHLEQGILHYDPQHHRTLTFLCGGEDPGVACRGFASWDLWLRGYPDQALKRNHEALRLAQEVAHPFSLAHALNFTAGVHLFRGEKQAAQERVEALIRLSSEQGFLYFLGWGTLMQGWALAEQGQGEEGVVQIRQGMDACQTTGAEGMTSLYFTSLAKAYGEKAQVREGLTVIAEALALVDKIGERYCEAELYRLRGELTLQQANNEHGAGSTEQKSEDPNPKAQILDLQSEAEACFLKAIEIAQKQQAKSLELRAVMSLARLRQRQALEHGAKSKELGVSSKEQEAQSRIAEAHSLLSEVYNWFTEGFDTKDLQEARELLEKLSDSQERSLE